MSESAPPGVLVEQRLIPTPSSISQKARDFLSQLVGPDGIPLRKNAEVLPAPDDIEGWSALKQFVNENTLRHYEYQSSNLTSTYETIELGGAVVHVATPARHDPSDKRVLIDIHAGGMVYCSGEPCLLGARIQADLHGVRCYAIDYRTPPEHCYPAGLDDCVAVYRALLEQTEPENIIVYGISGGGNLAAAMLLRVRDEGLPLPAAAVLITPEVDLTESGDSFQTNHTIDALLIDTLMDLNLLYADGNDLADPYLSPLFGDFSKGYPPTLLQAGTRDLFLSNAVRMHRALRNSGVEAELHVFEGMPHGGFAGAPEDADLDAEIERFMAKYWGNRS